MDTKQNGPPSTTLSLPSDVLVVDVGPRDGLQNEAHPGTTEDKIQLVNDLARAMPFYEAVLGFMGMQAVVKNPEFLHMIGGRAAANRI